ncbi:PAS domain-containing protein, partial [Patescibacteria group bacterium]|nr:PAS domain-containing protein [Patescibacteria group bacterium]
MPKDIKLEDIYTAIDDSLLVADLKGKIIQANPAASEFIGFKKSELIGKYAFSFIDKKISKTERKELISRAIENKFLKNIKCRVIKKDGEIVPISANISLYIKNGLPKAFVGIVRDESLSKKAEAKFKETELFYENIIKNTRQLIYDYNLTSGEIKWSGVVKPLTGYTIEEFNKFGIEGWENSIHPDDRKNAVLLLEKAKEEHKSYDTDYRFRNKSNEYRHFHDRGFFIEDEDGK